MYRKKMLFERLAIRLEPALGLEEIRIITETFWVTMDHPRVDAYDSLKIVSLTVKEVEMRQYVPLLERNDLRSRDPLSAQPVGTRY